MTKLSESTIALLDSLLVYREGQLTGTPSNSYLLVRSLGSPRKETPKVTGWDWIPKWGSTPTLRPPYMDVILVEHIPNGLPNTDVQLFMYKYVLKGIVRAIRQEVQDHSGYYFLKAHNGLLYATIMGEEVEAKEGLRAIPSRMFKYDSLLLQELDSLTVEQWEAYRQHSHLEWSIEDTPFALMGRGVR